MVRIEELESNDLRNYIKNKQKEREDDSNVKGDPVTLSKRKRIALNGNDEPCKKLKREHLVKGNGKGEPPLEEEEMEVALQSRSLYEMIQERRARIWISCRLSLLYRRSSVNVRYHMLCPSFKHWLRDVGQCMVYRLANDVGIILPCSSQHVAIVEGQTRLPNPSRTRANNVKDIGRVVEEYNSLCLEVFGVDKSVLSADKDHLLYCLKYIKGCQPKEQMVLFMNVLSHYTYGSSYYKLTFVEHSIRYLIRANKLEDYRESRKYKHNIYKTVSGNPILEGVYCYRSKYPEVGEQLWKGYENSSVGVLFFIVNFIKHADEQCDKLGCGHYSDDQKVVLLEYYFPGEMQHVFYYFWSQRMKVDRNEHLRLCSS